MKKEITLDEWIYHYTVDDEKYQIVDTFLEAVFKKCDSFIVTTDSGLIESVTRNKDSLGIEIYHVDEFLKEYLQ